MVTETAIKNYLSDHPETVTLPMECNRSIIGVSSDGKIAYDYTSLVKAFMETCGFDHEDACDYVDYIVSGTRDIVVIEEL